MTMEYWQQVRELFDEVKELDMGARQVRLAANDDERVGAEVRKLLTALAEAGDFIERPAAVVLGSVPEALPEPTAVNRRIGPYQTLREIGRGGMGVVWLATRADDAYQKQVAIKLVWPGPESGEVLRRFRQERQILAQLEHPNIARLLDGGTTEEGWPYLVMEYVEGQPITRYCAVHELGLRERLELFRTVCAAVQHAHQNLVVHRDLKPGNILVTEDGTVKLLDFGIAKLLTLEVSASDFAATRTGLHLMTPQYASPEQVRGEAITTASDVYSLGIVLYELLTGQRPYQFKNHSLAELERVICEQEPPAPSRSQKLERGSLKSEEKADADFLLPSSFLVPTSSLRGDLDNILLLALRKEARERYGSVEQLSEDVRRYLAGEAVLAGEPTWGYRLGKFVRRNRVGVVTATLLLITLLGGIVTTSWQARMAQRQARENRRLLYASQMNLAVQAWESANLTRFRELLEREWLPHNFPAQDTEDLRGFEWYYLWKLARQNGNTLTLSHPSAVWRAVYSPDGNLLATASDDHLIRLWDAHNGNELAQLTGHTSLIQPLAFSPDGNYLASGSGDATVRIWDVKKRQTLITLKGHRQRVASLAFSPDGKWLVSASDDNSWRRWDWQAGQAQTIAQAHGNLIRSIAYSPDGKLVATGGDQVPVKLWEARTGKLVFTFSDQPRDGVRSVAFSPDGQSLAVVGTDATVQVYEMKAKRLRYKFAGHSGAISALAFAPDGKMLATASEDRTVKLWDAAEGELLATLKGHLNQIISVAFSPSGKTVVSAGIDRTARIWEVAQVLYGAAHFPRFHPFLPQAFSPDGKQYLATGPSGGGYLIDLAQRQQRAVLQGHTAIISTAAFSSDGKTIATGSSDATVRLWEAATGKAVGTLSGHTKEITAVCFAPSGRLVLTGSDDHTAKLWDVATGQLQQSYQGHAAHVVALAFSPTQDFAATGSFDGVVKIWETAHGKERFSLSNQNTPVLNLAFSADGKLLASGGLNGVVRLWHVETGKEFIALTGTDGYITSLTFSPDGRRLATGSDDGSIRLWEVSTGQLMITFTRHKESVKFLTFTSQARLLSGSAAGDVYFWEAAWEGEASRGIE